MQINQINANTNFKAKFSPEFKEKINSLGEHLIESGEIQKYEKFIKDVRRLKTLYPDRTIEIIPFMEKKQLCIWEYNKEGQTSTLEENSFCPNSHRTNLFVIQPILQKVIALTNPHKRNLFISGALPYNCDYISTDTLSDIAQKARGLAEKDSLKQLKKPRLSTKETEEKKAELKLLLDA